MDLYVLSSAYDLFMFCFFSSSLTDYTHKEKTLPQAQTTSQVETDTSKWWLKEPDSNILLPTSCLQSRAGVMVFMAGYTGAFQCCFVQIPELMGTVASLEDLRVFFLK